MKSEFVMRPLDPARDAEKLAAMWNASDDQWPGTWSSGVPITPTMVKERLDRENRLEASVWDDEKVIAGYCSVWKDLEEAGVAYIALINVAPQFQGQSFARKFLVHWVSRITEMGFTRLDLHTWPGNLKAVPLYKKTGFNWMPDADSGGGVHMLNFIPAILKTPLLQPFFAKNDWYAALQRELKQSEDDERWEGMKVFTYRFDGQGGPVSVWADRLARTIAAIETPDLFAAAVASEIEPPRGLATSIRWRVSNRSSATMKISLVASGSEYLSIAHQEAFDLEAGDSVELAGKVEVAAEVSDLKVRKGKPMPAVKTILVVDGKVLELGTGMRPRRGVEVSTDPIPVTVSPGIPRECRIQLRSRLKRAVEATVSVVPATGLK